MATIIRSQCPTCGEVDLKAPDIALVRQADGLAEYRYVCPTCGNEVRKRADAKVCALLMSCGVEWKEDVIIYHPEAPDPEAPTLTVDDLIDLHFELEEL